MSTCMLAMKRPARIVKTMTITTTEACGTCLERVHVHPTKLPWPHLLLKFAAGACNRMKPNLYHINAVHGGSLYIISQILSHKTAPCVTLTRSRSQGLAALVHSDFKP
jgi:hypothetical protein